MPLRLALHADDFGMNRAVSTGILHGFRYGLLTSTSLLANAPDAARALSHWKELLVEQAAGRLPSADVRRRLGDPDVPFDLGVHLNLTQGRPLHDRYPAELLDVEGRFPGVFSLFARLRRSGGKWREAIREEWRRQIEFLCDHGLRPTHLNGHQYVEMPPATAELVPELMKHFGIKAVRVAWEPALLRNVALHGFQITKWPLAQVKPCSPPDSAAARRPADRPSRRLLRHRPRRRRRSETDAVVPGERPRPPVHRNRPSSGRCGRSDFAAGAIRRLARSPGVFPPEGIAMLVSAELPRCLEPYCAGVSAGFNFVQ